ncbi:MAG: hypothetical protein GH145_02735 [Firmicutes bacterium]|nr:hypothetical protein [Bacillota bacterium]
MSKRTKLLDQKVSNMKALLKCLCYQLRADGSFGACSGCQDQNVCSGIKPMVEAEIKKACDTAKRAELATEFCGLMGVGKQECLI